MRSSVVVGMAMGLASCLGDGAANDLDAGTGGVEGLDCHGVRGRDAVLVYADGDTSLTALHADSDGVYVGGSQRLTTDGSVRRGILRVVVPGTGRVTELWEGPGDPHLIRSSAAEIYFQADDWGPERSNSLRGVPKVGGHSTTLATFVGHAALNSLALGSTGPLLLNGERLRWIGITQLFGLSLSGGEPSVLWTSDSGYLNGLVVAPDGSKLYVSASDRIVSFSDGIASVLVNDTRPTFLLADSSFVYWASSQDSGATRIMRVPLDGGPPLPMATAQAVSDLSQDRCNLYWIDRSVGQILSVAK